MLIGLIISFVLVLNCDGYTGTTKTCNDCTSFINCPEAQNLVNSKVSGYEAKLRDQFCGFGVDKLPKVCCSGLSDLEHHPNINLLPENCGKYTPDKIVGGETAGLYEFPWMALISYKTRLGFQFQCGGSLINDRYVLTAAHCIVNQSLAGVRIGEHNIDTSQDCQGDIKHLTCESRIQDIRIEKSIPYPGYKGKPNVINDIGLIRLKKPVDLSAKNAGTICLPYSNELRSKDLGNLNATVAGWGYTETGYASSTLLKVVVPVYTRKSCSDLYNRDNNRNKPDETENKLCAGKLGKDSCGGDSGGPLMVPGVYRNVRRYVQHGIVSYGPRLCGSTFPGVYTDVTKYIKWILDNIEA